jgi:hypothetical protein
MKEEEKLCIQQYIFILTSSSSCRDEHDDQPPFLQVNLIYTVISGLDFFYLNVPYIAPNVH